MDMSPKEYKAAYFEAVSTVDTKLLALIGERVKQQKITAKLMHELREACYSYHTVATPDITQFKDIMKHLGVAEYNEMYVVSLLRYFNGKYPAVTLRNMYQVHPMYEQFTLGVKKLISGDYDKKQFKREDLGDGIVQYTVGKLIFSVPETDKARKEILEVAMLWINEKKAKSFEFVEVENMVSVHRG